MKIINLSGLPLDWNWLRDEFVDNGRGEGHEWIHCSSLAIDLHRAIPRKDSITRAMAAWKAVSYAKSGKSVLVSHGPNLGMYGGAFSALSHPKLPHLLYGFNFTNLPGTLQRKVMTASFTQVTKFVCFSTLEQKIYSEYFEIPLEKIDMIHWSVHRPAGFIAEDRIERGDYICALGSQGRDYDALFSAMKLIPNIRLVIVASSENIAGLEIPKNVTVHTNIPYSRASNILRHSRFMVVPLRDREVPCGHVTIVAAMFHGKAIVATNSMGIHDYIKDEDTGVFYDPKDVQDLARKITYLWEDCARARLLSENGLSFAVAHCTEQRVVSYFGEFLKNCAE
jgi:glycosyltransferase involved in cell wall biosynthesis